MERSYLTPRVVAERLGVTRQAVTGWLLTGRIEETRVGGRWRVTQTEVDRFLLGGAKGVKP